MELISFFGAVITVYCCWHALRDVCRDRKNHRNECFLENPEEPFRPRTVLPRQVRQLSQLYVGNGLKTLGVRRRLLKLVKKAARLFTRYVRRATARTATLDKKPVLYRGVDGLLLCSILKRSDYSVTFKVRH